MPNLCRADLLRVPWAPALSAVLRSIVDADVFVVASWCQQWAIPGQGVDHASGIQDFDQKELLPTRREGKSRKTVKNSTRFLYSLMWPNVRSYQIQNEINGAHSRRCWNHDTLDYGRDIWWAAICLLVIHPHGNPRDPPDIPKLWQHETHLYAGSIMVHAKHLSW